MSFFSYIKKALKDYGVKPKKKLGQSFVVDELVLKRMVDYANPQNHDVVLDVGSGFGFLTELLVQKAGRVVAVEIDPRLLDFLRRKFAHTSKVEIHSGDFLKLDLKGKYNKVVSSPPYSVVSKILFKILDEGFEFAILLLQKEFALRLVARPRDRDYSRLTVMVYLKAEVELLEEVPSSAFYPEPEVASVIVRIRSREEPPFKVYDWRIFEQVVQFMFTQRKKKVKNVLQKLSTMEPFNKLAKPFEGIPYLEKRVFMLKPEELGEISNAVYKQISN